VFVFELALDFSCIAGSTCAQFFFSHLRKSNTIYTKPQYVGMGMFFIFLKSSLHLMHWITYIHCCTVKFVWSFLNTFIRVQYVFITYYIVLVSISRLLWWVMSIYDRHEYECINGSKVLLQTIMTTGDTLAGVGELAYNNKGWKYTNRYCYWYCVKRISNFGVQKRLVSAPMRSGICGRHLFRAVCGQIISIYLII